MSQFTDLEVLKEIPGYQAILKAVLKSQIQLLVEQLSSQTGEESVLLTASVTDGTLCHLGSESGKVFLEGHEDFKSQFLGFCLKRNHKRKTTETTQKQTQGPSLTSKRARVSDSYLPSSHVHPVSLHRVSPAHNVANQRRPPIQTETRPRPSNTETRPSVRTPSSRTSQDTKQFQGVDNSIVQSPDTSFQDVKHESRNISDSDLESVQYHPSDTLQDESGVTQPSGDSNQSEHSVIKMEPDEDLEITGVDMMNKSEGSQIGFDQSQWQSNVSDGLDYGASGSEAGDGGSFDAGDQSAYGNKVKKEFRCRNCEDSFSSRSGLRKHKQIQHPKSAPHMCCNKKFFSISNLMRHKCHHHGEKKQFDCKNCGKAFAVQADLNRHERRESGILNLQCMVCGITVENKNALQDHEDTHTNVKRHTCTVCHKTFRFQTNLSRHAKSHITKVVKCEVCQKTFRNAQNLTVHQRLHTE